MKKLVIALTMAAILSGCSAKDKSSVSSEKEVVVPAISTDSTSATEATTAPESEATSEFEQDLDFQILEVEDDGITVLVANNIMQKIEIDCTELLRKAEIFDIDPEKLLVVGDYNFDSYDDLFMPETMLEANTTGTYYYFDPTVNLNPLKEWDELNKIGRLMKANSEKKTLEFSAGSGTGDFESISYKWNGGKLHPVSRVLWYVSDEQICIDSFEYDDDGNETLVGRKYDVLGENNGWIRKTEDVELS